MIGQIWGAAGAIWGWARGWSIDESSDGFHVMSIAQGEIGSDELARVSRCDCASCCEKRSREAVEKEWAPFAREINRTMAREFAEELPEVRRLLILKGFARPNGETYGLMADREYDCKTEPFRSVIVNRTRGGRAKVRINGVTVGFIYTDEYLAAREEQSILSATKPASAPSNKKSL